MQTSVASNSNYTALTVSNTDAGTAARAIQVTAGRTDLGMTSVTANLDGAALTVSNRKWHAWLCHRLACLLVVWVVLHPWMGCPDLSQRDVHTVGLSAVHANAPSQMTCPTLYSRGMKAIRHASDAWLS